MVLGWNSKKEMSKEKLKVLFFTAALGWGGITRVLLNVLKGLDRGQFTPLLMVYTVEGVRMSEIPQGIQVYPLNMRREGKGFEFLKLFLAYRKLLREINPDVVVSSVWKPHMISLLAHRMDFSKKRKLILREDMALSPYFRDVHGTGIKGSISPILTRLLYPHADHVVAVSEELKRESISFGIPKEKITVIHNPLDLQAIDQLKRVEIESHKPFILFVGRLCKQKNLPLLFHAFHLIKDRWDVNLLILGRGEEEIPLRTLVKTLGIEKRVLFQGYAFNPYPYMRQAQLFALSSNYEGFPCVLLEAMACGTPIISTNCPHGPNEIIRDGVNGFLVSMGDPRKLAEAIQKILADKTLKKKFVEQGHKDIQSYELNAIVRKYETLITDVYSKH
jgi:glycosyltransferase involved in cell wall biosynthesis